MVRLENTTQQRVSVKRGVGAGAGVGAGVGVGAGDGVGVGVGVGVSFFSHFFMSFFLSFNPNSDFSQFALCIVTIFSDVTKMNKIKCGGTHFFASPRTVKYRSRKFLFKFNTDFCNRRP